MAALIEQSTLKVYKGVHTAAFLDKRFFDDVREFTRQVRLEQALETGKVLAP